MRARRLVAAGVIRGGRRRDAVAADRRPVRGANLLDIPLGPKHPVAPGLSDGREPDLSSRYRLPAEPVVAERIPSAWALTAAIDGLDLDRAAHRLLVWADSWSAENLAGLVSLIEAARAGGGGAR